MYDFRNSESSTHYIAHANKKHYGKSGLIQYRAALPHLSIMNFIYKRQSLETKSTTSQFFN